MNSMNPVESYITVNDVFPNTKNDLTSFIDLLKGLSKTDSIFWCSRLNIIMCSTTKTRAEKQQFGVSQFLSNEDIDFLNLSIKRKGKKTATLFFRGQILELLRWIVLYCDNDANDGNTFNSLEVRRTFAKALLIASDIWRIRIFKNWNFSNENLEEKKRIVIGSIRKITESQINIPEFEKIFGRGWVLFSEYLPQYNQSFLSDFRNATGLSIEEYYICLSSIIANFMKDNSSNIFKKDDLVNDIDVSIMFQIYLKLESQKSDELKSALLQFVI